MRSSFAVNPLADQGGKEGYKKGVRRGGHPETVEVAVSVEMFRGMEGAAKEWVMDGRVARTKVTEGVGVVH